MRLIFGAALVAAIYVHSPHRPRTDLSHDLSRWASSAGAGLSETVVRTTPPDVLLDAALRRTLPEGAAALLPRAGERLPPAAPSRQGTGGPL